MRVSGHIRKRTIKSKESCYQLIIELPIDKTTGKRQRIYETVRCSKKMAEQRLRQIMDDYENQSYVKSNNITVSEWVDKWYNLYIANNLSVTTLQGYKYNINHYIKTSTLGKLPIQDVSSADVQNWINELSNKSPVTGKPIHAKTVKNIYHNLYAAFDKAVDNELIKKNVCKSVILPKPVKYQAEVYDEAEIEKLLKVINGTDMMLPITLDLVLGLRRGELLGLKWHNIDFDKKLVTIEDNLVEVSKEVCKERIKTKKPKSASGERKIPITDSIIALLKKGRARYNENKLRYGKLFYDGDYVVCQPNGKPYNPNTFSRKFHRILVNNGLKPIRLHDIRHPYVKLKLKILSAYFSRTFGAKVLDFPHDFNPVIGIYTHLFDKHIGKCLR